MSFPNETRQQLVAKFVDLADFLTRVLQVEALEEWRAIDMTIPQIKTLVLLQSVQRVRMGGIANYLGSTLSASTSVVDRLVDKGLVDRTSDPDDRRVVVCHLTESGMDAISKFWQIEHCKVDPLVKRLDCNQLETIVEALELIRQKVEEAHQSGHQSLPAHERVRAE